MRKIKSDAKEDQTGNKTAKPKKKSNRGLRNFIADFPKNTKKSQAEWVIAHASVIGKSHLNGKDETPCQDAHCVKNLGGGIGIAVVCDGAGSKKNSHLGSKFIAEEACATFEEIIVKNNLDKGRSISEEQWKSLSKSAFRNLLFKLNEYAKEIEVELTSLACTVIALLYFDDKLLFAHIGDGRATYQNEDGEWMALLDPHKGEEANQTIFITSQNWLKDDYEMRDIPVPQSKIVEGSVKAFALMSDGCESHTFELGEFDENNNVFVERNTPYPGFFNPVKQTILDITEQSASDETLQIKWEGFLTKGNPRFEAELDDKTMIFGVRK